MPIRTANTAVQPQDSAAPLTEIAFLVESLAHLREQIDAWLAVLADEETPADQRPAIDAHLAWLRSAAEAKRGRLARLRREADHATVA